MITLTLCLLSTLFVQTPPGGQTGSNQTGNSNGIIDPRKVPGGQPPNTDDRNRQPMPGPGQPVPPVGGGTNTGYPVMVDGTYAVLAYDKFGQPLPGMVGIKVVIRNSILTFPGDTKTPGKMLQLTFGPANTITVTPLDGTRPVNTNPNSPWSDNPRSGLTNGATQQGNILPQPQGETGVYVLSNEYFGIHILNNQLINSNQGTIPPGTVSGNMQPPGDSTRNATGVGTGSTPGADAARNASGVGTGGTSGGDAARNASGVGTTNNPARNTTGATTTTDQGGTTTTPGQTGNIIDPRRVPDPRVPQPSPGIAVLILRKVAQ